MAALCVVFGFVWNMQLVKSVLSHGIVEEWVVVVVEVVVVVVVVAHRPAVVLIQLTAALHAMNVVIIHMTVPVLVELVTLTDSVGGTSFCCEFLTHCITLNSAVFQFNCCLVLLHIVIKFKYIIAAVSVTPLWKTWKNPEILKWLVKCHGKCKKLGKFNKCLGIRCVRGKFVIMVSLVCL